MLQFLELIRILRYEKSIWRLARKDGFGLPQIIHPSRAGLSTARYYTSRTFLVRLRS